MIASSAWQWRAIITAAILFSLALIFGQKSAAVHSFHARPATTSLSKSSYIAPQSASSSLGAQTDDENGTLLKSYLDPFVCDIAGLPEKARMRIIEPERYVIMGHGPYDWVTNHVWDSEWEPHITQGMKNYMQAVISLDSSRNGYMDLGTNIGVHALHMAANSNYQVHMFEPTFANQVLVRCSLAMSGKRPNVRLNTYGVGLKAEEVCMRSPADNMGGSDVNEDTTNCAEKQKARIGTLNYYYDQHVSGKHKFAVVKMDIQGFEVHALKSATKLFDSDAAPVAIFFEYDHELIKLQGSHPHQLVKYFLDRDYSIYQANGKNTTAIPLADFPESAFISGNQEDPDLIAVSNTWKLRLEKAGYSFIGGSISGHP